ncbi:MAG: tetratricopeptide repeat protein [Acidobacteriota bacterium]|nr:tetratricopeptide repeat protein [Acidobacteriota bacterium]
MNALSPAMQAKAAGVQATQVRDYSRAAREFGKACNLDPKLVDVCYYQGRALYYTNRFEDALVPLRRSIEIGESSARAHSTIAQCLEALGQPDNAEREHRKAITDDPTGQYRVRYAIFLFRQGRVDEAVAPLTEALKLSPQDFEGNLQMGRILFEQDKFSNALEFLDKALQIRPTSTEAHLLAAKVCQQLGRKAEAEKHLKAAQIPEP